MDTSPQVASQNVVRTTTRHFVDDTDSFLLLLIIIWMIIFLSSPFFPRQNQHLHAHCATIMAIIIAVCTNAQYANEISENMLEYLEVILPIMTLYLSMEMDAASRRSNLPATSQQNEETNH
ncbi:unnamed protein product [Caenorhabditis angaria]|uniref:Uncharacterized protein n=1 Tax=Caenorhabditis angaria TaxID=860376 RepID=A0A9P1N0R7_9PELO|nr:unnamed protein product [Caenorhabditis angaria]